MIMIFHSILFSQLSYKLLFVLEEDQVKFANLLQFILENLSLCHSLYCHLQELVLIPRVFH
jgi:hypothetical protein